MIIEKAIIKNKHKKLSKVLFMKLANVLVVEKSI